MNCSHFVPYNIVFVQLIVQSVKEVLSKILPEVLQQPVDLGNTFALELATIESDKSKVVFCRDIPFHSPIRIE